MQDGLKNFYEEEAIDFSNALFDEKRAVVTAVYPTEYKVDIQLFTGVVYVKVPVRSSGGILNNKFHGTFDLPRIGDEVSVVFMQGNAESPIVVGGFIFDEEPTEKTKAFLADKETNDYAIIRGDIEFKIKGDESFVEIRKTDDTLSIKIDLSNNNINIKGGDKVIIDATAIEIGSGTLEKLIKSETFKTLFNANVGQYNSHNHGGLGVNPPAQVMTNMSDSELSSKIKTE